jgi:hypothetical protein
MDMLYDRQHMPNSGSGQPKYLLSMATPSGLNSDLCRDSERVYICCVAFSSQVQGLSPIRVL